MVYDRAFCQIKTFCDKGAERKVREEEKRILRHRQHGGHTSGGGGSFVLAVQPRSVFQRAFDLVTEPIFFTPKVRPPPPTTPPANTSLLALPAPAGCPSTSSAAAPPSTPRPTLQAKRANSGCAARVGRVGGGGATSTEERVMIFVRQENEEIFTPLHVVPPTVLGIVRAVSAKYQIDCVDIRYLFRRNARGIVARVDDDMVRFYCNGDVFIMKVLATEETSSGQVFYDIILAEVAPLAASVGAPASKE